MEIFLNDIDAIAYRDRYLSKGDEECEVDVGADCSHCGCGVKFGEECYRIRNDYICRECYEDIAEFVII